MSYAPIRPPSIALVWALVLASAALGETPTSDAATRQPVAPASASTGSTPVPRIVNGVETQSFPTAGALLDRATKLQFCSAVLVGCSTVLTAAHCVCDTIGGECQPGGSGLENPASIELFFQHAGFFDVQSITVPPLFDFGLRDDIAVLHLSTTVEGVRPSRLNSVERLAAGTTTEIVGFGLATEDIFDNGLKRSGQVTTAACTVVPAGEYVCWEFEDPLGPPGTDANTCNGDSGGPLFVDFGSGDLVAGIGSGGLNADCQPDDLAFDADVFANLSGIAAAAGSDLGAAECGSLPVVAGPGSIEIHDSGEITQPNQIVDRQFQVPAGARSLRVALNAEEGLLVTQFDLFLSSGSPPPVGLVECASTRDGAYEFCDLPDPAPGTWNARVVGTSGTGSYQLTTTILREVDLGPCVAGPNTLCIDDAPGDARFEATVAFDTSQDGTAGLGNAVDLDSLGITSGGVFWFFNRENPEVLLKVLPGCVVNGYHWVFWSAGTNVRMVITVTDRRTGRQRVYQNPDLTPALPVTDTEAFTC